MSIFTLLLITPTVITIFQLVKASDMWDLIGSSYVATLVIYVVMVLCLLLTLRNIMFILAVIILQLGYYIAGMIIFEDTFTIYVYSDDRDKVSWVGLFLDRVY